MSQENSGTNELEIGAGDKKLKIRGSDLLTSVVGIIVCSGLTLLGYVLYEHKLDARDHGAAVVQAVKEMTSVGKEGVIAQRVMNCLLATDQKEREKMTQTCERLAR